MAHIVMADDGIPFNGTTPEQGPLGGAESAFVSLANAFAVRGNLVSAFTKSDDGVDHRGVSWRPLKDGLPEDADIYIANRSDRLLSAVPGAATRIFWIHNPATYLLKWRYLSKLYLRHPVIVFSGVWHAASCPRWVPTGGRAIVPYGIDENFRNVSRDGIAPPVSVFTSNPLRSLDWLLDLWAAKIHPAIPEAELHVYSGPAVYGTHGDGLAAAMQPILDKAKGLEGDGVRLKDPVSKDRLAEIYAASRVMLYRGDPGETFCLAVGESQAAGVPAIVQDIGCVAERVIEGETGYVAADDEDFAQKAITLLGDDALWQRQSDAAISRQRNWGWDDAAAAFEGLTGR